jgi:hypothetical protein
MRETLYTNKEKAKMLEEGIIKPLIHIPCLSFSVAVLNSRPAFVSLTKAASKTKTKELINTGIARAFRCVNFRHIMFHSSLESGLSESLVNANDAC